MTIFVLKGKLNSNTNSILRGVISVYLIEPKKTTQNLRLNGTMIVQVKFHQNVSFQKIAKYDVNLGNY